MKTLHYSGILTGLLAAGLAWANGLWFNASTASYCAFIFFATVLVYNIDRFFIPANDRINHPERYGYIQENRGFILFLILISAAALLDLSFRIRPEISLSALGLGILTVFYFFLSGSKNKALFWLSSATKPAIIGFVWAAATVALPVFNNAMFLMSPLLYVLLGIRFFEYSANAVLCDHQDFTGDAAIGGTDLKGKNNTFKLAGERTILTILAFVLIILILLLAWMIFRGMLPLPFLADLTIFAFYLILAFGTLTSSKIAGLLVKPAIQNRETFGLVIDGILFLPVIAALVNYF